MNEPFGGVFRDRRVFVTGHTGFKGAWLTQWLLHLGARVSGYSLPAPTEPSLFKQLALEGKVERHYEGDINDFASLREALDESRAEFVFHLAAQPLVRESYQSPLMTWQTNVLGTVHLLEALRLSAKQCAVVVVTSDKCYENREWVHGYRETDPLGGHDPYSASKGAAELVTASYRKSFFQKGPVRVASGRAGNVIGGGDWARDRIVPDCVKALQDGRPIPIRNRNAVRPWQHVLEPLGGYLWLAANLLHPELCTSAPEAVACAFNFGPDHRSNRTVLELVQEFLRYWPGGWEDQSDASAVHEAKLLQLSTDKANAILKWAPVWAFSDAVQFTASWYYQSVHGASSTLSDLTLHHIEQYCHVARAKGVSWITKA